MRFSEQNDTASKQRRQLLTLCRFLGIRITYRLMLLLLCGTGLLLTAFGRTQFAPFGIALVCLLLPSFLGDAVEKQKEKENDDILLPELYKRYRYSPSMYTSYRITVTLGMLLLFVWHVVQVTPFTLFGFSVPLLYTALCLALSALLGRILYLFFHRRLMGGTL